MGYIYTHKIKEVSDHKLTKHSKNKIPYIQCECGLKFEATQESCYNAQLEPITSYSLAYASLQAQEHLKQYR